MNRPTMTDVVVRDSNINISMPASHRGLESAGSNDGGVCRLDPVTGSYGKGFDESVEEASLQEDDVETEEVSFVYQIETLGALTAQTLNATELFITEHMLGYMIDDCDILSSANDKLRGLRILRDRNKSKKRTRGGSLGLAKARRRAQQEKETLQLAVVGLSSPPPDEIVPESEIPCVDQVFNYSDCVVVEGKVVIATNTSAGRSLQIQAYYYDAIRSTFQDQAINWTEADQTILNVTYRGDSRKVVGDTSRPRWERMWIPGVTLLSFFVVLLIAFLIYDRKSPYRKRWESSHGRGVKIEEAPDGDAQLGLSDRIDEDPNEDEESSSGEGRDENTQEILSAAIGDREAVIGEDGFVDSTEETKAEVIGEVTTLKKEIDSLDPRIDELLQHSSSEDSDEHANEYISQLKMPSPRGDDQLLKDNSLESGGSTEWRC